MYISTKDWKNYIDKMSKLNKKAADAIVKYVQTFGFGNTEALVKYANTVVQTYGTGSAALAAAMYDATAEAAGVFYDPAEPAPLPEYGEVAKTVYGSLKRSRNVNTVAGAVGELVKRVGADTTLQNAYRDRPKKRYGKKKHTGAQVAWVPVGDTCPFCLMLASNGWREQSVGGAENHAEHIHANCDCNYAVRFDYDSGVDGYDPEEYTDMFADIEGDTWNEKVNVLRRKQYEKDKDRINAQKRAAYAQRVESLELYRKTKNTGAFSAYSELMSKKHVNNVVSEMGLNPNDVRYKIDRNEEMIGSGFMGHISDDGKEITLYPDSFKDREQLVKTIGHENIHLKQIRKDGKVKSHLEIAERENEAILSEEKWWSDYVKRNNYKPKQ